MAKTFPPHPRGLVYILFLHCFFLAAYDLAILDKFSVCVQRVKVYRLNDEGKWDDKGTGHVSVEYLEVRFLYPSALIL